MCRVQASGVPLGLFQRTGPSLLSRLPNVLQKRLKRLQRDPGYRPELPDAHRQSTYAKHRGELFDHLIFWPRVWIVVNSPRDVCRELDHILYRVFLRSNE